jgi:hypothetical protein
LKGALRVFVEFGRRRVSAPTIPQPTQLQRHKDRYRHNRKPEQLLGVHPEDLPYKKVLQVLAAVWIARHQQKCRRTPGR